MSDTPTTPSISPTEAVKKVVIEAAETHGHKLANAAIALGFDVAISLFGREAYDRILGRKKVEEAQAHAEKGDYQKAWETLHEHAHEKRRRIGRALLRAQRRLLTPKEGAAYRAWVARQPEHIRHQITHYYELYLDEDLQVTDLATFIQMKPKDRLNFLTNIHEHGLADTMRENHAAVVKDNKRLDREYKATCQRISNGPRHGFFHGLFRLF